MNLRKQFWNTLTSFLRHSQQNYNIDQFQSLEWSQCIRLPFESMYTSLRIRLYHAVFPIDFLQPLFWRVLRTLPCYAWMPQVTPKQVWLAGSLAQTNVWETDPWLERARDIVGGFRWLDECGLIIIDTWIFTKGQVHLCTWHARTLVSERLLESINYDLA